MPTVAEIAKRAFDGVARGIPDAIHAATISHEVKGAYDNATDTYASTVTTDAGRCVVDTVKPVSDVFEDYIAGPSDQLVLLEGFGMIPAENWTLEFAGRALTIKRVQDIVAAGTLFYVLAV